MSRIEDVLPLSSLQQGMLFHALFDEQAVDVYTVQTVLDLEGALDAPRLRAAATELLRRHANLRAAFVHDTGDPVAVVLRDVEAPWVEHNLSTMDEPARAAEIDRLLAADRVTRFAMQEPPLVRFLLLRTASERHRLVVSNHHILLDGWSMPLLVRELLALYAGEQVPRVRPYRDYLAWLRTRDRAAGAALWADALADPPSPTLVAPASAAMGAALPDRVPVPVPDATWDALTALARRHGLTPNTVLQGAWGLVLAQALGRDDVVFGATVSGRPPTLDGVADMVGLFVNTLPVRVRVRPAEPVSEFLARLQSEQAALLDHQYLGLPELGAAELFDTLFVFESYPVDVDAIGSAESAAGLRVRAVDSADATNYPLALTAGPGDAGQLVLSLDHRPDVFDAATAHRWAARLARALDAIVAEPDLPVARLNLLDDDELATVTALSIGPDALPLKATVLDELHARTAATPNAVAVVAVDGALTFAELDDRAWRLARLLTARGAGPERIVAVLLPRTTDLVVAMVAAWKAGAAFGVVDPAYPDERIQLVLEDLDPAVLVTEDVLRDRPEPNGAVLQRPSLGNAAYVVHTSGTTGRPKGVIVQHRALANLLAAHRAGAMAGRQRMRVLGTASFAFDAALDQLLWMIAGHELHLADEHTRHDPDALVDLVRTKGIGHLDAAPALLAQLVARGLLDAPDLAVVTTGGEAVPAPLWERLASSTVDAYDCYGPTEATVDATVGLIGPGAPHIGRPVAGARVHVLDHGLAPVAAGVPGELYLGGEPLARGYLGRPGSTAERFVANPFGIGRLYRTGDLVRWNDSGVLEFLGRTDDQLSVRGFRVEPGEIEAALAAHPAVTAAAVVARADGPGTAHLVAYAETTADPDELRAHLAARLPEHLVPDLVVPLDTLPVTPHGKIDKRALPAPTRSAATHRAPASPLEERLCDLFAEVLGLPRVSPDESFFALGGDSIVSMQLVGKARAAGLAFSPRDVFEARTPAALAVRAAHSTAHDEQLATADAETLARWRTRYPGLVDVWPLTPLQEGLLFHAQFDAGDPGSIDLYAVQSELELVGPLDHDRLRDAGRELLARHENLRTAFVHDADRPVQIVLDRVELPWTEIDLSGRDEDARAAEVERIVAADRVRRFDLTRPPLLRCTLIRLAEDRHRLLITNHHIVLDGWSSPIVVADLFALYAGEQPPPVRPFRDHLAWLAGRDRDASREAWRRALDGVGEPTLLVPAATNVEAAVPEQRGIDLDDRLTARLTALARDSGVTLNAVVQTAWGIVLGRLTGRSDVVFGATVSGRAPELAGSEHMVGLFVNTVPVRVRLDAREPLCALVKRVQAEQTALLDHQYLGLAESSAADLFDTLTVFESYPVDEESLATAEAATGLRTVAVDGRDATHYPVVLVVIPGERLHLGLKYLPYAADQAANLLDRVVRVLVTLADTPDLPCGQVDVLAAGERARVVELWNATDSELGAEDVSLFDLFAEQVAAVPDALAVGPLTYAELDARVSALAGALRDAGVRPESLVGLHIRRSTDLVVALLAVLKAGGAFVPLQPEWPVERLASLYASAGLRHVVTAGGALPAAPEVTVLDVHALAAPLTAAVRVDPESLAYVIFTSGSTGTPKGAMIRHRAICARLRWQRGLLGFGPGDAALFKAPLGFDISINEIFLPLTTGARLVIADPDGERDAEYLLELITRERVSFAYLVSSMVDVMLEMPAVHQAAVSLKHVWCGGEVLTPALFDRFRAVFTDSVLYHGYGPAEATIGTSHRFYRGEDRRTSITIGRPNPNTQMYVLDANLRPCPVGVLGELYAGGLPLGRGYVGDPSQTSARFVANPYGAPGSRLYRTGDLGRWAPDGELEFVGRADHQVKIRGMRVELEEVDAVLARHPAVRQAITVVRGKNALAAYVTTAAPTTGGSLREHAAAYLPEHMVPATVTTLESFPLNTNGKVDRAALPDPEAEAVAGRAPSTPLEHRLAGLFAAVLGTSDVGVTDSFFSLGGDSIGSMQLVARARADGLTFSPREVFERPTVAALAELLAGRAAATPALVGEAVGPVPLTPIVRWLTEQGPIDSYSQAVLLVVPPLTHDQLHAGLTALLRQHDALRSRLHQEPPGAPAVMPGGPTTPDVSAASDVAGAPTWRHEVLPVGEVEPALHRVPVTLDGTGWDAVRPTVEAEFEDAVRRLDLAAGRVLQAVWFDAGTSGGRLLLVAHHAVVDGVSWRVIARDLAAAVTGTPIAPAGTSLRAWASGLATAATDPARAGELSWWQGVLAADEPLLGRRPLDRAADTVATVAELEIELPTAATRALLTRVPEALRAGVTDLLLAALATAVTRHTGHGKVLVSLEGHGREEQVVPGADLSRTVGWFTTVFPVSLDVPAGTDLVGTVRRVKEHVRSVPDAGIGYGLLRYLNPATSHELARHRGPQIGFNYLGRFDTGGVDTTGERAWEPAPEFGAIGGDADPDFPVAAALEINAATVDGPDGPVLCASWAFPTGVLTADEVQAMADAWRTALVTLADRAERPAALTLDDLDLVSVDQRTLDTWRAAHPDLVDVWPLTPLQEGLLFHAQLDEHDAYVVQTVLDLEGPLDADRLRHAVHALLDRHPNLRTAFVPGGSVQLVLGRVDVPWTEVDLTAHPDPTAELARLTDAEQTFPFDLTAAPLVRVLLVHTAPDRHRFVLSNHHILLDGWSMPLLVADLFALYAGEELPPPPAFRGHLAWLAGRDRDTSREAWRHALDGAGEPTVLVPAARGRVPVPPHETGTTLALTALARRTGVTVNALVQAAWGVVLARATGRQDVLFGATVSGRAPELAGSEHMVGLFVNTVPVRVRLDAGEPLSALVMRVQAEQAALLEHQYLGLGELPGGGELFDTLTVFESYPVDDEAVTRAQLAGGLTTVAVDGRDATHYPVVLVIQPDGPDWHLAVRYHPDVVTVETAAGLLDQVRTVIDILAATPELPCAQVDVLPAGERRQVVELWNATASELGAEDVSLFGLFAEQVASVPGALAVGSLTYAELDARVSVLAGALRDAGVGPETLVGVHLRRSADLVVALLAVLKAGGAFVPLQPEWPVERLASLYASAGLRHVVTAGGALPAAPEVTVLDVHTQAAPLTAAVRVDPESLAYVIFTSGSTGTPKGAMIRHRAICARLRWQRGLLGFGPGDAALFKAPLGFDISINEIFLPLTTGARLVLAEPQGERDAEYLLGLIVRERVSFAYLVSSMVDVMLEMPAVHDAAASLTHVWCGGEVLTPALFDRFRAVFRDSVLYHGYGPAEATIGTSHRFYRGEDRRTSITIGRPNPNTQMYVLDANLQPCAVGVLGELYAGGLPLGRGYVGDPGQTSARFVANPYGAPGSRLYRTGDLGRWASNGELEFVGRADHQVKIRGMRVELEEIDAVLARHPAVRQAITVARRGALAGYVTTAALATEAELRTHAAAHLPEHMVPTTVTTLESFPLNANGKVDRAALPDREAPAGRMPSTSLEHRLAALFAAVLDRADVGVDDSFFVLGGHSLLATRLVARIRAELDTDLPLRAIFEHPTVAGLARRLAVATEPARPALLPRPRPEKVPLSPAQQRLWFLYQLDGPSPTYDIPFVFRLDTRLDVPAFRAALRDVVGRHEALRTVLVSDDHDGPWQRVLPLDAVQLDVPVFDAMADLPRTNGFELDREPPLRCTVVRTAEADTVVLVVHHVAADEWSADVLFTDLTTAYEARRAGAAPDWRPLPVQYADYTLWQRDLLGAEDDPASLAGRQLDHWRTALAGLPARTPLPTDRPAPPVASHDGSTVGFTVAPSVYARLRELARSAGATEFMAVTAAVAAVLHKLGAGDDVPLGTAVAGRTDAALDALVGFFVNTVVLRADTSGNPTLRELLTRVRDTALDAYANADVPFERVVEALNPHRSLGHHPLFQTMVLLQQRAVGTAAVTAVDTGTDEPTAAKFDLAVEFVEDDAGGLDAVIVHRTDLFDRTTVARLAERLGTALDAIGSASDTRLAELDVLTDDERTPRPALEPVPHNTIPSLFTAQVRRTPDAPAVDGLTYAELDARANRLAHLLVVRGAGPERTVAIALPRDAELVVAVLAVLKAGAAYLPLDPTYPLPRQRFMLADAAPTLLLTTTDAPDGPRRLCLDDEHVRAELAAAPPTEPASASAVLPDHLAYLIYTSGSTGRPKGVAVPHRNVAGLVAWAVATLGPQRLARTVFSTSLSFDVSVFELFAPLLSGGSVRVVPDVLSVPEVEEPTLVSAVPSALAAMLDRGDSTALAPPSTAIVLAGEAATWDLVQALRAGAPDRPVFNFFGPTETTVYSTGTALGAPAPGPVPIGVPVTSTVALVVDAALRPVPTGVPGELYLGGGHLARGYHAQPGLTATRFVADPDGPPGARLYRTGDLVRRTNSGELEFLGRADQQVKIRGFRIEPGEVEAALRTHPAVAAAAVVARDDSLVAYVVPANPTANATANATAVATAVVPVDSPTGVPVEQAGALATELREYLAERLPAHLVPTVVVTMDALPLTPNGKLDRAALPAPRHTTTAEPRQPSTPVQRQLMTLFADVLGVPEVGVDDSFFDLGGHSLLATRLAARVREAMHTNVSVRTVFEAPTVARLAERLGRTAPFDPVLTLRAGAPEQPALFCLPPAIGLGWSYARLLPHLDDNQPVHAIQTTGLPAATVDELAAACADLITRTRPDGPYLLLGWSFGAVLAHAVAARLTAAGHTVPLVVMLDGYPERPPDDAEPMGEADALYELLLFTGYDTSGLTEDGFGIDTVRAVVADQGGVLDGVGDAELLAVAARIAAVATLKYGEFATLDDASLLFFRAHDDGTPPATDWQPHYTRPMTVHEVAATHLDLLNPQPLQEIGPVLSQTITKGTP